MSTVVTGTPAAEGSTRSRWGLVAAQRRPRGRRLGTRAHTTIAVVALVSMVLPPLTRLTKARVAVADDIPAGAGR